MLKRIQKISNIGRFIHNISPGIEFGKDTIIFGNNTQGKSTLTAILRSLQTGNNDILIGRKTFGVKGSKFVEIDFDNSGSNDKCVFQNKAWDKQKPELMIFDSKFITENVFDGENVTFEQQKNLNNVIIGKKGQELNLEITELQNKSDALSAQKSEKTAILFSHFPGTTYDSFEKIAKRDNVESELEKKEKEIKFEKEKDKNKQDIESHINSLEGIDFSIKKALSGTLDIKQDEIENHIKSHFSTETNARNFLREGLGFLKNSINKTPRICVFCGQEMSDAAESLVKMYSKYFKGGYEELRAQIKHATDYFHNVNLEALLEKIRSDMESKGVEFNLDQNNINEIVVLKKTFEQELEKKNDLNYKINFTSFDSLEIAINKIIFELKEIRQTKINPQEQKTVFELENEKKLLEIVKKRYEPEWIKFCEEVEKIEKEAKQIRDDRDKKRKELEEYSASVFAIHKKTINELCKEMGADFEICDFQPIKKIVGKTERIFALKFFGTHKVELDTSEEYSPGFRNTLSESDKRLLAFAFFLSLLMHDPELDNKIIIFDDPMSSFDTERRRKTTHLIADVSSQRNENGKEIAVFPCQKIILTHDEVFARELFKNLTNPITIKIDCVVEEGQKRSCLAHSNFTLEFPEDEISSKLDRVKSILDNQKFADDFNNDCRIILEHIYKRKYRLLLKEQITQKKGVRTFVDKLNELKINGYDEKNKYNKFKRLCDDLNIELHDNNSSPSNGDKESILKDFFQCLEIV